MIRAAFFVNTPGVYTLARGPDDLHSVDQTGLLARVPEIAAVAGDGEERYDRIEKEGGPGMPLEAYLPKAQLDFKEKWSPSLTPSEASIAVAASLSDTMARKSVGIKIREKRLDANIWRCKGVHQKGSHFPICVFTNNVGRRSPAKMDERKIKKEARQWQGSQWRTSVAEDAWQQACWDAVCWNTMDTWTQPGWNGDCWTFSASSSDIWWPQ